MEAFETIIRPIGNSFGVILPKQLMQARRLRKGQKILISILPKHKVSLKDLLGTLKGTKPFVREHEDRSF